MYQKKVHKTHIINHLGIKYHIRKELSQFTQIKCYYSIVDPAIKQYSNTYNVIITLFQLSFSFCLPRPTHREEQEEKES